MAQKRIRVPNPDLSLSEKTILDVRYTSGTSLTVVQNYGFQDNDIVVVGEPGEEKTEWRDCVGITDRTVISVSSAYDFDHEKGTPVYRSEWQQVLIERKTTLAGSWSEITQSNLQWDKPETIYIDTTGSDDYYYRYRFYNTYSGLYSEHSPTLGGGGFSRKQVGYLVRNVRRKINDPRSDRITDTEIIEKFQEGLDIIDAIRPNWWFRKVDTFKAANGISTAASTYRYSLATYTDFNYLERLRFHYNDGTDSKVYDLEPKDEIEFDKLVQDQDRSADDWVACFKLVPADSSSDQGYIEVYPTPEHATYGTFYPEYWKKAPTVNSVDDETDIPVPQVLEAYALWKAYEDLGNETKAQLYKKEFYGPAPKDKDNQPLTGIALLEHMNKNQGIATGNPKTLWRFRGQKGASSFGEGERYDRDSQAERYW